MFETVVNAKVLGIPWESVFLVLSQGLPMQSRLALSWQSIYLNFSNARITVIRYLAFRVLLEDKNVF